MSETSNTPALTTEQQKGVLDSMEVLSKKEQVLKDLGQIEAFQFVGKLATVANLKIIQNIKETKAYKGLTYIDDGKLATVASFDQFCKYKLDQPTRTIDDWLLNLKQFGEEFYEASRKVGLTSNHLRKLRQLPNEDRMEVMQNKAIESGNKEQIREVIDELHFKYKQEAKSLDSKLKDTEADLTATRDLNAEKTLREEELKIALEKSKYSPEDWPKQASDIIGQVLIAANAAFEGIDKLRQLITHIETLAAQYGESQEIEYHSASVFLGLSRDVAERAALMMEDGESALQHYTDGPRPAQEVLEELAISGSARELGIKPEGKE